MFSFRTHGKAIMMGLATVVMALLVAYREATANGITPSEFVLVVIAGFNAVVVWGAANVPWWPRAKNIMAAVGVVLNVLVALIVGGLTTDEVMLLVIHFLGALGVVGAPSVSIGAASSGTAPIDG